MASTVRYSNFLGSAQEADRAHTDIVMLIASTQPSPEINVSTAGLDTKEVLINGIGEQTILKVCKYE